MSNVQPVTRKQLLDTFSDSIERGARSVGVEFSDETVAYLSNLLWKFLKVEDTEADQLGFDEPVAFMVLESMQKTKSGDASQLLEVGELSIINCAFFEEYLTRRAMSVDYYQEIGKRSFMKVSRWYQRHDVDMVDVFKAIARKFEAVVASVRYVELKRKVVDRE